MFSKKSGDDLVGTIRRLFRIPLAIFGFAMILAIILSAIFAPWIVLHSPTVQDENNLLGGSSWIHPLGTDQIGRDTLSRIIYGSRIALIVGIGVVGFSTMIGVPIGLISAHALGWVDVLLMRAMDALLSFPSMIIAIGLVSVLGGSLLNVIIAIGTASTPWIARIARSTALSVREQDYVKAARSIGASDLRIIVLHLWPNCTAPVIVQATLTMAYAILIEAALGFLGVSVQPPTPTWGNMLRFAFRFLEEAPMLSFAPGVAIFLAVLAFNFVGDALRDVLDPRLRGLLH